MTTFQLAAIHAKIPEDAPKEKDWSAFTVDDTFNDNKLEGYLCRSSNRFYGALLLTYVNSEWQPQFIFCTPKLHYPVNKTGEWHFPKAQRVEAYTKLDGTNIFAYVYLYRNTPYQTFKTRQTAVVSDTVLIPFKSLLLEVLDREKAMAFWRATGKNLSFELYGAKNPHLINYSIPISLAYLFCVDSAGNVFPPSSHPWDGECAEHKTIRSINLAEEYKDHQQQDENRLRPQEDGTFMGSEGRVWYLLTEGMKWVMLKCKPHSIELIHWASGGIGRNVVTATALNAIESGPLTVEAVKTLLLEEFSEEQITKSSDRITSVVREVIASIGFRDKVLSVYDTLGLSISGNKVETMRTLDKHFNKKEMKKVYSTLKLYRS